MENAKIKNTSDLLKYLVWANKNVEDAFYLCVAGIIFYVADEGTDEDKERLFALIQGYDKLSLEKKTIQENLKIADNCIDEQLFVDFGFIKQERNETRDQLVVRFEIIAENYFDRYEENQYDDPDYTNKNLEHNEFFDDVLSQVE